MNFVSTSLGVPAGARTKNATSAVSAGYPASRNVGVSGDGLNWRRLAMLAEGGPGSEYSYPAMAWADGALWLSYTDQRQRIAWQRWQAVPQEGRP